MEPKFLLPHRLKAYGWVILIPSLIMAILWILGIRFTVMSPVFAIWGNNNEVFTFIHKNIYNEIVAVPLLISLLIVTFAKEKIEDEYMLRIRLESLVWSIYINFGFLLISTIFIFRDGFNNILIYNMFTILFLFVLRFHYVLFKEKRQMENEK